MNNDKSREPIKYDALMTHYIGDVGHRTSKQSNAIKIIDIELDKLSANKFQTRLEYDDLGNNNEVPNEIGQDKEIDSLKHSIEIYGLQQPIGISSVKTTDEKIKFQVIFGHRRVLAYKLLFQEQKAKGIPDSENRYRTIKAIIHENENLGLISPNEFKNIDKLFMLNVVENLYRKDLNLIEKAIIYETLQKQIKEEVIEKEYEIEKAKARKANIFKVIGKTSIALKHVADFLKIDYISVLRAVRAKNSLHEKIVEEILEARKSNNKKIRLDSTFLIELATLRGTEKQLQLWKDFQDTNKKISREDMRDLIRKAKEELELVKINGDYKNLKEKGDKENRKTKNKEYDGIKIVRDKQGFKIRNEKIAQLDQKEEFLLKKEISKTVNNFLKEKKTSKFFKKLNEIEIAEEELNLNHIPDDE